MPQPIEIHNTTLYILVRQDILTGAISRGTIPLTIEQAREQVIINTLLPTKK
jgi:hypothetical protein